MNYLEQFEELDNIVNSNEKTTMLAIFNKLSGEYVGNIYGADENSVDKTYYSFKEISINPNNEQYEGNYLTGSVKNLIDLKSDINESELDDEAGETISEKYQLYSQINILSNVIQDLIENKENKKHTDAFYTMKNVIDDIIDKNNKRKDFYRESDSHILLTKEDIKDITEKQNLGGIDELIMDETGVM